ncbi:MAG TPA: hypothetical protein VGN14_18220 [Candidatus Elarobacter sp.]
MKLRTYLLASVLFAGTAVGSGVAVLAAQPNMQNALDALTTARTSLIAAAPDKGGHRGKAIRLVNQAIAEVNAGMRVGSMH